MNFVEDVVPLYSLSEFRGHFRLSKEQVEVCVLDNIKFIYLFQVLACYLDNLFSTFAGCHYHPWSCVYEFTTDQTATHKQCSCLPLDVGQSGVISWGGR